MVTRMRTILGSSSNKNPAIISLYATESYRNIKVNIKKLSSFFISINIIKSENFLIEFEKMYFIC